MMISYAVASIRSSVQFATACPTNRPSRRKKKQERLTLGGLMEAAIGFEPMHGGFADLSLNHLGTPPRPIQISRAGKSIN